MIEWTNVLILVGLPLVSVALVMLAVLTFLANLPLFRTWRGTDEDQQDASTPHSLMTRVSVLIPARDEADGIAAAIRSVLANEAVELEVVVMDDGSTDGTGEIVRSIADDDSRVRLIEGIDLPDGWNGKQHACYRLASVANYDELLFIDADVRLQRNALRVLSHRMASRISEQPIGLLSAFPRQETGTLLEKMLIPMMHFILLCYLPFSRMRGSTHPAYASGCGQLFFTDKASYQKAGTHEAIRNSRHDGLKLPKAYRSHGLLTDCVDGTDIATCRMYTNAGEVVRGLLKNANEGIANKRLLIPFTILLGGAHLLPWFTLIYAIMTYQDTSSPNAALFAIVVSVMVILVGYVPRILGAIHLKQSWTGAFLHPIAVLVFLICQWLAFLGHLCGKQIAWRGRASV